MKKLKKIWFIICMAIVCSFGLTACMASAETQAKIDVLLEKNDSLAKDLDKAYKDHKEGRLTTTQLSELTSAIKVNIDETKAEVLKMREDGVGIGELITATLLGMASRGIPSKGPLGLAMNLFSARRKEA